MSALSRFDDKPDISFTTKLRGFDCTFESTWGIFSPKAIDEGTRLLIDQLELSDDSRVLDLGCGYGPIGIFCAKLAPHGQCDMVDKDFVAVELATRNASLNGVPNARAYLSNGMRNIEATRRYDVIVSNIPAKIGAEQLTEFLQDARDHLTPGGSLYVVFISGLKDFMKRHMSLEFASYEKLKQSRTYTAARSIKAR